MVTIVEIARSTGFSKSTVSAVLSAGPQANHASQSTRRLILDMAKRLGYSPNQAARSLRQKQSNLIAILDATNYSSYSPQILRGINDVLRIHHCQQMHCIFENAKELKTQLSSLETFRPDGWVVLGYLQAEVRKIIGELIAAGKEVVQVCSTDVLPGASAVYVDPYEIGKVAADYFITQHHRHILYAAIGQGERCRKGFTDSLNLQDADCFMEEYGATEEYGRQVFQNWLTRGKQETAVFAFSDVVAAAIISEAAKNGIRIPEELSVLGVNNTFFGSLIYPSLSTVALPQYDRGYKTGELLMRRLLAQSKHPPEIENMHPEIIERDST